MSSNLYDKTTQTLIPYAGSNEATTASLESLSNVLITSPTNGQVLAFDAGSLKWKNTDKQIPDIEMNEIYDVSIVSVSNGQILKWNQFTSKWENSTFNDITSLGAIPNVHLDQLENGQFLVYDTTSGMWLNTTLEYQAPLVADYGISIDPSNNKIKTKTFVGTIDEWYALSLSEQMSYDFVNIKGDEQTESYDIQIAYVDELPSEGTIQDIIYGLQNYGSVVTTTAADGFLDSASDFTKTTVTGGYKYTSDTAVISLDNYSFYPFDDITYDGTKFVISWGHGWTDTDDLALGDTLYYKVTTGIQFYGGHSATQSYKNFANPVDVVENGNMSAVTSNAVFDVINNEVSTRSFLGAKNLLPFDISHMIRINGGGTWDGLAYTYNGVTYTLLSDGTVRVNGTATAYSLFRIIDANSIFLNPSNDYYITGSPSNSTASTYYVYYSELINGSWVYYSNLGDEDTLFTPNTAATQCVVDIVVRDGQTADNVIFKPMLRLVTDTNPIYQPYAMTNQQMTPYIQATSNPNLLDNPWFTVNQRGNTFYQTENSYCVDRWILGKGAFTARETNASYGVLQTRVANTNGWLRQKTEFELDPTKPITYSAIINAQVTSEYGFALKFSNMDDYTDSKMKWFPTTANQKVLVHFTDLPFKNTAFEVIANAEASSTVKIYSLKVELGTVSTLAMDTAPNYQQELAKCQRYFQRIGKKTNINLGFIFGSGVAYTTSNIWFPFYLSTPMRIDPTLTLSGRFLVSSSVSSAKVSDTENTLQISTINFGNQDVNMINIALNDSSAPFTIGTWYKMQSYVASEVGYINLSADL